MSAETQPLVSVVIPVHNGERYLDECLQSVLRQTYRPIEILVVDDGSADNSAQIARRYAEVRCLSTEHGGVSAARNHGIAAARGEFIAFLDADDLWDPNKLRLQIEHHLEHPELGYTISRIQNFLQDGTQRPPWLREKFLEASAIGYNPPALVVWRDVFETVGVFDPEIRVGEGADWFIRASGAGIQMAIVHAAMLYRRVHDSNTSHKSSGVNARILKSLKSSLDRRRGRTSTPERDDDG